MTNTLVLDRYNTLGLYTYNSKGLYTYSSEGLVRPEQIVYILYILLKNKNVYYYLCYIFSIYYIIYLLYILYYTIKLKKKRVLSSLHSDVH